MSGKLASSGAADKADKGDKGDKADKAQAGKPSFMGMPFGVPAGVNGSVMSSSIRMRMADCRAQRDAAVNLRVKEALKEDTPAKPPNVLVDAVCFQGSGDAKQKPLTRHVIVKDLNKVAKQLKFEIPNRGIFANKVPMGLYCIFDGMSGAGASGPVSAEFCARNFHNMLLKCLSELGLVTIMAVETALKKSMKMLDQELLAKNPQAEDGCGAVIALLAGSNLFVALMGRCAAILCEVDDDGQKLPNVLGSGIGTVKRSLGDKSMKGVSGAPAISTPDVQTIQLGGSEKHPFLILVASTVWEALGPVDMLKIAESFPLQPRIFCGEVTTRSSFLVPATSPCTAVQVNFLPDAMAAPAEPAAPPAKKAKLSATAPSGPTPTQSMRLRHFLVKFHEGPKPADDPKAKWASRTRPEAEKMLRSALIELRQNQKEWTKTPKDGLEEVSMSTKKFTQLARQISDCPTAQKGALACGDLGWLTQKARADMSEHFREVCDVLQPGQWSDIAATSQGLHLVQRIA